MLDPARPVTPGVRLTLAGATIGGRLSGSYTLWVLLLLSLIGVLDAVDRNILSLLLVPIKQSLHASDAAMGALSGTAFALVNATVGLPMARLADRGNRRNLIVLALAFWSAMTAVCGLARTYAVLLVARCGVGIGMSAAGPATTSLIGDLFPENRRGGAIGVLSVGSAVGFSLGSIVAGVLNDRFGWHAAMLAVGLPGLVLAAVMWLTMPEPVRGIHDEKGRGDGAPAPVWVSLKRVAAIRTMTPLLMGTIFVNVAFLAWVIWLPAFLMRVHHLGTTEMSIVFALSIGVGGVLSNVVAGFTSDRLARRGARWRMYYCCLMIAASVPLLVGALMFRQLAPAVACMGLFSFTAGGLSTVTGAAQLSISPPNMRAFISALFTLVVTVLGAGVGPWAVGGLNDALQASFGDQAIRFTLLMAPTCLAIAGGMFFWASFRIGADMISGRAVAAAG